MDIDFALAVCDKMEIFDQSKRKLVFRYVNIYPQDKIVKIVQKAYTYSWWHKSPHLAFMKAVGEVNREEKDEN